MRRTTVLAMSVLLILSLLVSGCAQPAPTPAPEEAPQAQETQAEEVSPPETAEETPSEGEPAESPVRIGMITDLGGIDDASFNQTSWQGVVMAIEELGVEGQYLESQQQTDYARNINEYIQQDYDLIITVGFLLGDDTEAAANQHPDRQFAIVDYAYNPPLPNVLDLMFATDEAAFMAGYLAAGMTKTGVVGTFGGIDLPTVSIFMVGFASGVDYYNDIHDTDVRVLGTDFFVGNFDSTDDGRRAGESLMDEGADIIMPVAGPVGLGTAAAVQERGAMLIGVDTDWYMSAPEYRDITLSSVIKKMDIAVFDAIQSVVDGTFTGGTYLGTLENNGVDLAEFHEFDDAVSQELKDEIEQVRLDLIAGKLDTGWTEE